MFRSDLCLRQFPFADTFSLTALILAIICLLVVAAPFVSLRIGSFFNLKCRSRYCSEVFSSVFPTMLSYAASLFSLVFPQDFLRGRYLSPWCCPFLEDFSSNFSLPFPVFFPSVRPFSQLPLFRPVWSDPLLQNNKRSSAPSFVSPLLSDRSDIPIHAYPSADFT